MLPFHADVPSPVYHFLRGASFRHGVALLFDPRLAFCRCTVSDGTRAAKLFAKTHLEDGMTILWELVG